MQMTPQHLRLTKSVENFARGVALVLSHSMPKSRFVHAYCVRIIHRGYHHYLPGECGIKIFGWGKSFCSTASERKKCQKSLRDFLKENPVWEEGRDSKSSTSPGGSLISGGLENRSGSHRYTCSGVSVLNPTTGSGQKLGVVEMYRERSERLKFSPKTSQVLKNRDFSKRNPMWEGGRESKYPSKPCHILHEKS